MHTSTPTHGAPTGAVIPAPTVPGAEQRVLRRVAAVDWRSDPTRYLGHAALLKEFLRRAARCEEALVRRRSEDAARRPSGTGPGARVPVPIEAEPVLLAAGSPLRDWAGALLEMDLLPAVSVRRLGELLAAKCPDASADLHQALIGAMHWAAAEPLLAARFPGLEDPWEPVMLLLERGGAGLEIAAGFLRCGAVGVVLRGWEKRTVRPAVDLATTAVGEE